MQYVLNISHLHLARLTYDGMSEARASISTLNANDWLFTLIAQYTGTILNLSVIISYDF